MEASISFKSSGPSFLRTSFLHSRSDVTHPQRAFFPRAKQDGSFSLQLVPPNLLAAEKEEAKAVLTLFLKKQGLSNAVASRTINKSEGWMK